MSIPKANRVLIVINELASGETDYLYRFIENSGRSTIQATLGDDYEKIVKLYGKNATYPKLLKALRSQGARKVVKRIDLIVMLHGSSGSLEFSDGTQLTHTVQTDIAALHLKSKLRLVYNTSCYGDSHSQDFIAAGFDAAIGSKKVNANAAVEFPLLLSLWQFDFKLVDCLAPSLPLTPPSDAITTAFGHANNRSWRHDVNSTKVIRGDKNVKIST